MDARNKLLDKARVACSASSDAALASRLTVSAQQVSRWRKGHDRMPNEQIARIARLAHLDAGEWVLLIEAEQNTGEAGKAYGSLVKRLGIAALLDLASVPGMASISHIPTGTAYYVNRLRRLARFLRVASLLPTDGAEHADMLALQG